jgi:protein phosphatase 2C family protein 2/3
MLGPHRVFPGRLSVCRTFGDVEAKAEHLLGNPKVVIADPDISFFRVDQAKHDFVVLGCDGIFDKLENKDVVHTIWQKVVTPENS